MIDESQYRLPKQEQPEPKREDPATIAYLESLPWRPFGIEW